MRNVFVHGRMLAYEYYVSTLPFENISVNSVASVAEKRGAPRYRGAPLLLLLNIKKAPAFLCAHFLLDRHGDLEEERQHQEAQGVNADGDQPLQQGRNVFVDLVQRVASKGTLFQCCQVFLV